MHRCRCNRSDEIILLNLIRISQKNIFRSIMSCYKNQRHHWQVFVRRLYLGSCKWNASKFLEVFHFFVLFFSAALRFKETEKTPPLTSLRESLCVVCRRWGTHEQRKPEHRREEQCSDSLRLQSRASRLRRWLRDASGAESLSRVRQAAHTFSR